MTRYSTHARARAVADQCALDDPAWSYHVRQSGAYFVIVIFDEENDYVGTL